MVDARLKKLGKIGPFIAGSLYIKARACGYKNCKCTKGFLHESYYLTDKVNGKTRTVYIPREMEEEVKQWAAEYQRIKKIIEEVSNLQRVIIRKYATEKLAKKKIK